MKQYFYALVFSSLCLGLVTPLHADSCIYEGVVENYTLSTNHDTRISYLANLVLEIFDVTSERDELAYPDKETMFSFYPSKIYSEKRHIPSTQRTKSISSKKQEHFKISPIPWDESQSGPIVQENTQDQSSNKKIPIVLDLLFHVYDEDTGPDERIALALISTNLDQLKWTSTVHTEFWNMSEKKDWNYQYSELQSKTLNESFSISYRFYKACPKS
ncbi:MAG: hypothetical protein KDD52_04260 [Bdellovibrionales bacterium]|nr:hypothetical protein [Bdellovibrionales bacterium]